MIATIESAIKHCEEVAKEQRELFSICPIPSEMCDPTKDCASLKNGKNRGCIKCAKEHERLAEWLKELKKFREQETCDDCISKEAVLAMSDYIGETPTYSNPYAKLEEVVRVEDIKSLPPVRPKIKTGRWIDHPQGEQCSECGLYVTNRHNDNWCPNCGSYNRNEVIK